MIRSSRLRLVLALLVLAALAVPLVAGSSSAGVALTLAPVAAMFLPLLFGRFVGEHAIARLRLRRVPARRLRPTFVLGVARRSQDCAARGGRIVARRLAGRAPPLLALR